MDLGPAWRFKILSYGLWERRFDRDPSVIGRSINLDGRSVAVTGVLPRTESAAVTKESRS